MPKAPSKVLIVENDPIAGMDVFIILEDLGLEPIGPVPNVLESLNILRSQPVDRAILDVSLVGEDSKRVAKELKFRSVPFVYATGNIDCLKGSGFPEAPVIAKPATESELFKYFGV